ncbi:MAG: hypothetical protein P4M07_08775 [Xanthobacteraceae bacterium]|nr:hypothetical protein [Xanthobacteraceae bacterium]
MTKVPQSRTSPRSLALFALACATVIGVGIGFAFMVRPMVVAETTGSVSNACAARLPTNFSARVYDHCVAACLSCERGTPVTCSTSCRLRGAT